MYQPPKPTPNKKYIIIGVSIVVLIILIVIFSFSNQTTTPSNTKTTPSDNLPSKTQPNSIPSSTTNKPIVDDFNIDEILQNAAKIKKEMNHFDEEKIFDLEKIILPHCEKILELIEKLEPFISDGKLFMTPFPTGIKTRLDQPQINPEVDKFRKELETQRLKFLNDISKRNDQILLKLSTRLLFSELVIISLTPTTWAFSSLEERNNHVDKLKEYCSTWKKKVQNEKQESLKQLEETRNRVAQYKAKQATLNNPSQEQKERDALYEEIKKGIANPKKTQ